VRLRTSPCFRRFACCIAGHPERTRIGAPQTLVRAWQLGHARMPEYKFLRLVDILTELDPQWTVNRF